MKRNIEEILQNKNITPTAMRFLVLDFLMDQQVAIGR